MYRTSISTLNNVVHFTRNQMLNRACAKDLKIIENLLWCDVFMFRIPHLVILCNKKKQYIQRIVLKMNKERNVVSLYQYGPHVWN